MNSTTGVINWLCNHMGLKPFEKKMQSFLLSF